MYYVIHFLEISRVSALGVCIFFERSFENHFENENKYCKN